MKARITIVLDEKLGTVNRNVFGHFAEHLGRCVYEGMWVGEDSPIPNVRGIRTDVVNALRRLDPPVLRWPGGCFADDYHWRDGIGPREARPQGCHCLPEQAVEGGGDRAGSLHADLRADGSKAPGAARDLRRVLRVEPPGRVHPRSRPACSETQPGMPLAATMELYRTLFPAPVYEMKGATIDQYYAPYWPSQFWSNPLMSPDDMKQLNAIDADIRSFVTKTQAKWITEGGIETEWDGYLKQLDTLGLSKMLQIRQAGFDRLNKK